MCRQLIEKQINRGVKFLKKLCCCIGGRAYQGNLGLSTQLIVLEYPYREIDRGVDKQTDRKIDG